MRKKGFTLIELLVVIAIIGVLSSIIFSFINDIRSSSRDVRRKSDLNKFATALEIYYDTYEVYPCGDANYFQASSGLQFTLDSSGSVGFLDGTLGLPVSNCIGNPKTGLYTAKITLSLTPEDPLNVDPHIYWYQATLNRQHYILWAQMENSNAGYNDGNPSCSAYEIGPDVGVIQPFGC